MIEIVPLTTLGEVRPGDDLPGLLARAIRAESNAPRPQDILVVSQKVVSKSENRFVDLRTVIPSERAAALGVEVGKDPRLVEVILRESIEIIRASPRVLIVRHRCGYVMANAGVDQSNLGSDDPDMVLLLPFDPDQSAGLMRAALATLISPPPAIVIADSFGRPWRQGVVNVAIGASGLPALLDRRGELDRDGRPLEVTQVALADIVACAAGAAFGEAAEGIPAALVRGLRWEAPPCPAGALVRPLDEDLFR